MADEPIDPRADRRGGGPRLGQPVSGRRNAQRFPPPPLWQAPPLRAGSLHGCDDFQSLIPAFVRGELAPARALLVEDHTRSCVPCRRALREAREGKAARPARPRHGVPPGHHRAVWVSLAAVLAIALGFGLVTLVQEMMAGGTKMARIDSVEGTLYRVAGDSSRMIRPGETIDEEEALHRQGVDRPGADGSTAR